jgi:hypothetical protein
MESLQKVLNVNTTVIYELKIEIKNDSQAMIIETNNNENNWKLWHYRLGHLSTKNMKILESEDVKFKQINLKQEFCVGCALGKAKKLPHKIIYRSDKNEQVAIHSDLVGPMKNISTGKKKYMVTYICNQTEYSFVYYLKNKDEQFEKFKEFKQHYELLTETKIKYLKIDNGGEYLSKEFEQY